MTRIRRLAGLLATSFLLAGCGFEAPTPGTLHIGSDPEGAAITIDGVETGDLTPHTYDDLEGNTTYAVTVAIEGMVAFPGRRDVLVPYGGSARADFSLSAASGSLQVTSEPAGAAIWLDGEDTGEATPYNFAALVPGDYLVTVVLANHASTPAEILATVQDGEQAVAAFELVLTHIPRIVLVEGFSNTYCIGCPTMNTNVKYVLEQPGYGPDRVLHVKWPGSNPSPLDPFYWVTQSLVTARFNWYFGSPSISLPTLTADGVLLGGHGSPYGAEGLLDAIDGRPAEADVLITVTTDEDLGDVTDLTHAADVSLLAPGGADLTGHVLHVVLVYEAVDTENTGYQDGVTEYHWVMRDHVQPSSDLGPLAAGQMYDHPVILNDPLGNELSGHAVYPVNKQIIAWIQHGTTRAVVQAGSTIGESSGRSPGHAPDLTSATTPGSRHPKTGGTR